MLKENRENGWSVVSDAKRPHTDNISTDKDQKDQIVADTLDSPEYEPDCMVIDA